MQAFRRLVQATLLPGARSMGGGPSISPAARWSRYFPEAPEPTAQEVNKSVRKELIGFLILGPASAALMLYDIFGPGLEQHEHHIIPPYPWMRIRRLPGMPWGENGLLEFDPLVASEWPPAEGLPEH